jgi:hypothetical protein
MPALFQVIRIGPKLDFIHLAYRRQNVGPWTAMCRKGFSMSRKALDVRKVISLIINGLCSKAFMPCGNG